jgi:hypothetical protein
MQQLDATAEPAMVEPQTVRSLDSFPMPRLAFLVRRFHAQVERQRRADEQLVAGLERVSGDPRVRRMMRQIIQESER